ncbi:hypothetical protein ACI7CM_23315, partial [Xanthobacter sp. AM33]|uniref:hypothetical protein n=1 Tax=Xanthobacter sp. AM33 TaxID=3380644 RepID=UPI0039BFEC56
REVELKSCLGVDRVSELWKLRTTERRGTEEINELLSGATYRERDLVNLWSRLERLAAMCKSWTNLPRHVQR